MPLNPESHRKAAESPSRIAAISREECLDCAALIRDVMPILNTERQLEIAEEMARDFEARAMAKTARPHSA